MMEKTPEFLDQGQGHRSACSNYRKHPLLPLHPPPPSCSSHFQEELVFAGRSPQGHTLLPILKFGCWVQHPTLIEDLWRSDRAPELPPLQVSRELGGCGCRTLECGKRLGLLRRLLVPQRSHALPGNPDSGLAYFQTHSVYYVSRSLKKPRLQLPALFVENTDT